MSVFFLGRGFSQCIKKLKEEIKPIISNKYAGKKIENLFGSKDVSDL